MSGAEKDKETVGPRQGQGVGQPRAKRFCVGGGSGMKNHTTRPIARTKTAPIAVLAPNPTFAKMGPDTAPPRAKPSWPRATARLMSEPRRSSSTRGGQERRERADPHGYEDHREEEEHVGGQHRGHDLDREERQDGKTDTGQQDDPLSTDLV